MLQFDAHPAERLKKLKWVEAEDSEAGKEVEAPPMAEAHVKCMMQHAATADSHVKFLSNQGWGMTANQ